MSNGDQNQTTTQTATYLYTPLAADPPSPSSGGPMSSDSPGPGGHLTSTMPAHWRKIVLASVAAD